MNNEFERNWKEVVMAYFKILSLDLSGETKENHENLSKDSQCPDRDSNLVPHNYKSELLPLELTFSIIYSVTHRITLTMNQTLQAE
jgi:hypothetical protein